MECQRCHKEFNTQCVEWNAETYGNSYIVACPHCGQAYRVRRITRIEIVPTITDRDEDDWGKKIRHH